MDKVKEFDFKKLSKGIHRIAVIGYSGSGKTTLCYRMLEESFLDRTDIFVVYAQNRSTLSQWEAFFDFHGLGEQLISVSQSKDDKRLKQVIETIEQSQDKLLRQGKKILRYVLILDDILGSTAGSSLQKKRTLMHSFSYQSRHNNMSVFYLLQDIVALSARELSSNTCNVLMKDESYCNMENHYESKILGQTADQIFGEYRSKGKRVSEFCRLMRNLGPFEGLCSYRNLKTQKTKLYIITNVEK